MVNGVNRDMDSKIFGLLLAGLMVLGFAGSASAYYNETNGKQFDVADLSPIFIDTIANATVEVKGDIPTLVDVGVLIFLLSALTVVVGMVVAIFLVAPQKFKRNKKV